MFKAGLTSKVVNYIATPALNEHMKMVSEEYNTLANWIISKNYQNLSGLRKFGYLTKKGKVVSSWKRRFFILTDTALSYFQKAEVISLFLIIK